MSEVTMGRTESADAATRLRGAVWWKSRYSNPHGACVEVAELADRDIGLRNSRHPDGAVLICTRAGFAGFLGSAKGGDFDDLVD